jgi:hypothetical protein|tara:strand:- start:8534 stop:9883 length:1350 start_codon:yes stop_codon:yes gene_type:complete
MRHALYILLISSLIFAQSSDAALTIYKDGTALIKQPVAWSVPSGYSYVTWGDLPNGMHRDTPFLNMDGADIISQRFNDNVFSGSDYFNTLKGKEIQVKPKEGKLVRGTLLEISSGSVTISHQSGIISFNRSELEYIGNKKADISQPSFHPYLSWDIKSKSGKVVEGELVYKTNNFSWNTVYRLKMINEEKGELIAEAVVSNSSNMDFKNAFLKLVEGNLNKVRTVQPPRPERMNRAVSMAAKNDGMPMMGKDELGDYHIYSLNDTHDLGAKENITVRMYGPLDVGYEKKYVFENTERRQKEEPLEVQLTMENTESNGLGISLPGGKVEMYSYKKVNGLEYIGADKMGQVPKGQSTTLTSGRAFDVTGNRKVLNYDRQRKSEEAVIEIKVSNARNEEVNVLLVEHINGDWIIKDESLNYQKKDASTVHFPLSLNAGETKSVYYTYRKEWK